MKENSIYGDIRNAALKALDYFSILAGDLGSGSAKSASWEMCNKAYWMMLGIECALIYDDDAARKGRIGGSAGKYKEMLKGMFEAGNWHKTDYGKKALRARIFKSIDRKHDFRKLGELGFAMAGNPDKTRLDDYLSEAGEVLDEITKRIEPSGLAENKAEVINLDARREKAVRV